MLTHLVSTFSPDFSSKYRAKLASLESNRFMADVDLTLMPKVFHILNQKWKHTQSITARRMISGRVLKKRSGLRLVISLLAHKNSPLVQNNSLFGFDFYPVLFLGNSIITHCIY